MKYLLTAIMIANAALFVFGAVQHVGFTIGPFHEPHIIPAAIVESICALSLFLGATALVRRWSNSWGTSLITNLIAMCGVFLGMIALAAGRGPRTASNDLYHRIMLILIAVSVLILFAARSALKQS
ncbi:MAG TPA: hypothetical protein VEG30_17170 [Terriglobales bacterium]|nr:hypothetical protein [Terriglobales bacterium]